MYPLSYADQIIFSNTVIPINNSSGLMTFNRTRPRVYSNVSRLALSLCGFKISNQFDINFTLSVTSPTPGSSVSSYQFQLQVNGTVQLYLVSYFLIITTGRSSSYLSLDVRCINYYMLSLLLSIAQQKSQKYHLRHLILQRHFSLPWLPRAQCLDYPLRRFL